MRLRIFVLMAVCLGLAGVVRAQVLTWEPAPGPYGGTVAQTLATTAAGHLLAGTSTGILRSTDGGATWRAYTDGFPAGDVRAIVATPDGTLYAGLYGDGVFARLPGAQAWTPTGLRGVLLTTLLYDARGSLFAGTLGGLLRSDDDGASWKVIPFFNKMDGGVQVLAANETYLFAGTKQGVYRSSDGGVTWEAVTLGLREFNVTALATDARGNVFAGTSPASGLANVYRSRNHGGLWTSLALPSPPYEVPAIGIAPDGAVYVGGFRIVFRSTDEGDSWTQDTVAPVTVRGFAFTDAQVVAGTNGRGLVRAALGGRDWQEANAGVPSAVYDVALGAGGVVYAATAGGVFRSSDRGTTWARLAEGLTAHAIQRLAFDAEGRLLAGAGAGLYRLDAATETWAALGPPGNPAIRDLAVGPDSALYAGYYAGVYRLGKGGLWERYPLYGPDEATRDVIALAVDAGGTIFAGSYWDAFRTEKGPTEWSPMSLIPVGTEGVQTFLFAPDGRLYAGTRYSGILYSTDRGATWTQQVRGLTGLEDVRSLAFDHRGRLYAGTYGSGIFRYDPGADLWREASDGLLHRRVTAVAFDARGNAFAATQGGGLYRHRAPGGVGREADADVPERLVLHGNYPNPFNPTTTLRFDLPAPARVGVEVFDLLGRRVVALAPRVMDGGPGHTLVLDAGALPSGVYLYRLTAHAPDGLHRATGRMTVLK